MTNCTRSKLEFPPLKRRKIEAEFSGGAVTSDGGVLLLRQMNKRLGLLEAVDKTLPDPRNQDQIKHTQLSLLEQRVYGLCLGYEDLNDHSQLRSDPAFQAAVNCDNELASQATLSRLENRSNRKAVADIHKIFLDQFISSFKEPPEELHLNYNWNNYY